MLDCRSQNLVVGVGDLIRHRARDEAIREEVLARRRGAPHRVERHGWLVMMRPLSLMKEPVPPRPAGPTLTRASERHALSVLVPSISLAGTRRPIACQNSRRRETVHPFPRLCSDVHQKPAAMAQEQSSR